MVVCDIQLFTIKGKPEDKTPHGYCSLESNENDRMLCLLVFPQEK